MNKTDLIEELKIAYDIEPEKRNKFIRKIKKSNISLFGFIINQTKYIRFGLFLKLLLFAILMIIVIIGQEKNQYRLFSYSIPISALILIYIIDSSRNNHMEELEMATRFSLKMVILVRMFISVLMSFILVCIISIFSCIRENISLLPALYMFFLPYFATICVCLKILRKNRDNGFRYCLILSSILSVLMAIINACELNFSILRNNLFMLSALMIVVVLLVNEIKNYVKNLEELLWNL